MPGFVVHPLVDSKEFQSFLASEKGGRLHFPASVIAGLDLSVKTKPFVLIGGVPGAGKTSLAVSYARYVTGDYDEPGYRCISVRASWKDSKPLLGFFSHEKSVYHTTPFLDLLLCALRRPDRLYFAVLDGFNTARADRYLADVLSALEAGWTLSLHPMGRCIPKVGVVKEVANLVCHDECDFCFFADKDARPGLLPSEMSNLVPPKIRIPSNFVIIGTLQGEDWTGKVDTWILDRCNLVCLDTIDLEEFFEGPGRGIVNERISATLVKLHRLMSSNDIVIGLRSVRELINACNAWQANDDKARDCLDLQVRQRLIPRLERLTRGRKDVRTALLSFLIEEGLLSSARRIEAC